jgi:hypothetical protein
MTSNDIRRLINNHKETHVPHAFRAGGAAMEDFNRLYPVLRELSLPDLAQWMALIDKMRETHDGCLPCSSKILAYSIAFTEGRLPELCQEYTRQYHKQISDTEPPAGRDYMAEVLTSLRQGPESPMAREHKRHWDGLAVEMEAKLNDERDQLPCPPTK